MAQVNVNIRLDETTKKAFEEFCDEIGLSVSAAFNIFAKTVVREHRIPFELTLEGKGTPSDREGKRNAASGRREDADAGEGFRSFSEFSGELGSERSDRSESRKKDR